MQHRDIQISVMFLYLKQLLDTILQGNRPPSEKETDEMK